MKSDRRFTCLWIVFLISRLLAANNDTLQLSRKADSLFGIGHYYEAGNYYQKAAWYSSGKNKITLLLKKVDCLKQEGKFAEAEQLISRNSTDLSDSLLHDLLKQGALCAYLAGDCPKAESYLVTLGYRLLDKKLMEDTGILYALVLNEEGRWSEAKEKLLAQINYGAPFDSVAQRRWVAAVEDLYAEKNYPHLKNPRKARILSHFIPGAGQMYAGKFWEGAGSLGLNLVILGAAAAGVYYHYYFSSLVLGNFFFGKFYLGNIERAEFLVNQRNYLLKKKFNSGLKSGILDIQK